MRIQNNIPAINAHRMYSINAGTLAKSVEKLASGYRINRAGDDAAGLAISEKMRAQIRGLTMASRNAQDGISLIQTAEGALGSLHDILGRMSELAVQAANGTMDDEVDRAAIDLEFQQLKDEINRVAAGTNFNGRMLLDGSLSTEGMRVGGNLGVWGRIDTEETTATVTYEGLGYEIFGFDGLPDGTFTFNDVKAGTGNELALLTHLATNGNSIEINGFKIAAAQEGTGTTPTGWNIYHDDIPADARYFDNDISGGATAAENFAAVLDKLNELDDTWDYSIDDTTNALVLTLKEDAELPASGAPGDLTKTVGGADTPFYAIEGIDEDTIIKGMDIDTDSFKIGDTQFFYVTTPSDPDKLEFSDMESLLELLNDADNELHDLGKDWVWAFDEDGKTLTATAKEAGSLTAPAGTAEAGKNSVGWEEDLDALGAAITDDTKASIKWEGFDEPTAQVGEWTVSWNQTDGQFEATHTDSKVAPIIGVHAGVSFNDDEGGILVVFEGLGTIRLIDGDDDDHVLGDLTDGDVFGVITVTEGAAGEPRAAAPGAASVNKDDPEFDASGGGSPDKVDVAITRTFVDGVNEATEFVELRSGVNSIGSALSKVFYFDTTGLREGRGTEYTISGSAQARFIEDNNLGSYTALSTQGKLGQQAVASALGISLSDYDIEFKNNDIIITAVNTGPDPNEQSLITKKDTTGNSYLYTSRAGEVDYREVTLNFNPGAGDTNLIGQTITVNGRTYQFAGQGDKDQEGEFITKDGSGQILSNGNIAVYIGTAPDADDPGYAGTVMTELTKAINAAESKAYRTDEVTFANYDEDRGRITLSIRTDASGNISGGNVTGGLQLQVGDTSDAYNILTVGIQDMSTDGLGISALHVRDIDAAREAVGDIATQGQPGTIKAAINSVSMQRAALGAMQNRLEYTIQNIDTSVENLMAAEGRIRDTDMAKEMTNFTKTNILFQASIAMLAQANAMPQAVLSLLG